MLQTYNAPQAGLYEDEGQGFDLSHYVGALRRRIYYFTIPFLLIVMVGFAVVAIQRPIYRAQGKILVESPEIPPDLVHPTITEVANERVQVIQQRIMTRDNLMDVVNKYNLFPREREWMSGTELLDLMRSRMEIKPVALDAQTSSNNPTIAFTLSFDYEIPAIAQRVANEFLTAILSEDAATRTNNASETTKFLDKEVKRIQTEHDAVVAQIAAAKVRPPDQDQTQSEETKAQIAELTAAQTALVQASAVYSDEHPIVKNLRKKIAALKHAIAAGSEKPPATPSDVNLIVLERQEAELGKALDDANRKLSTARLGESMERAQQGERLQVIEQPSLPQKPVRPQRMKWYAAAFALAGMIGAGFVFTAESLDKSIRRSRDLSRIIDRHLIVTIPYLSTPGEQFRKRRNVVLMSGAIVAILGTAIAVAVVNGVSVDFSWFDRSWLDALTRLLH